ncbi:hypothetical protein BDZ85DRAFT_318358 [Elsinoe ampelina]|uniref:Uncharacterized protein n=1 Tax=Elsinoe ampelina TaxID=302913 RepID=A0A6A6GFD4_9PEZI|nr:hypothetical protein BDZ85DRAFT_318358 [Elsinoe ampelina]
MSRNERIVPIIDNYQKEEEDEELLEKLTLLNTSEFTFDLTSSPSYHSQAAPLLPFLPTTPYHAIRTTTHQSTSLTKRTDPPSAPSRDALGRVPTPQGHEWWKSPIPTPTKRKRDAVATISRAWGDDWVTAVLAEDLRPKVPTGMGRTERQLTSKEMSTALYEDAGKVMDDPYQYSGNLLVALAKVAGMSEGEGGAVGDMLREAMEERNRKGGAGGVEIVLEVLPDDVWEVFGKITGSKQG